MKSAQEACFCQVTSMSPKAACHRTLNIYARRASSLFMQT